MASLRTTIAIAACCLACFAHAQSRDDDKYLGIGESDRMTLRFTKPAGDEIAKPDIDHAKE